MSDPMSPLNQSVYDCIRPVAEEVSRRTGWEIRWDHVKEKCRFHLVINGLDMTEVFNEKEGLRLAEGRNFRDDADDLEWYVHRLVKESEGRR